MKKAMCVCLFFAASVWFVGCASMDSLPNICDEKPAESCSLICDTIGNPKPVDLIFRLAKNRLVYHRLIDLYDVREFLTTAIDVNQRSAKCSDLVKYIMSNIKPIKHILGPDIILVQSFIEVFDQEVPYCEWDRYLVDIHLKRQIEDLEYSMMAKEKTMRN